MSACQLKNHEVNIHEGAHSMSDYSVYDTGEMICFSDQHSIDYEVSKAPNFTGTDAMHSVCDADDRTTDNAQSSSRQSAHRKLENPLDFQNTVQTVGCKKQT